MLDAYLIKEFDKEGNLLLEIPTVGLLVNSDIYK